MWTLRKKMLTKKDFWWLTGLKFKKQKQNQKTAPSSHLYTGALMQTVLQGEACTELPACTVVLPWEPALIKEFPWPCIYQ